MTKTSAVTPRSLATESNAPLYKEVEREILQCLARGEWKPGDRLPSEPELAERLGVAVFTLRSGIQKLVDSGVLLRRQGKGTFVALHRARPLRNQYLRIYSNEGHKANWDRELVSLEKGRATDEDGRILQLGTTAADRAVYHMVFLLKNEGKTVAFVETTMPARRFGAMNETAFRDTSGNFYAVFQEKFGVNVIRIDERVKAARAGKAGARWLGVAAGDPVLRIERVAYTYHDAPVEFRTYTINADDYYYFSPPS